MYKKLTFMVFISLLLPSLILLAQGKIRGKITDSQTGEPLIGANVLVVGTTLGAATDQSGDYVINNIQPGTYQLKASFIGYQSVTLSNVRVSEDLTTESNFQLPAEGVTVGTVEVTAERPLVNKSNTNAQRITTSEDIQALPVRGVNNIIGLNAGVVLKDNQVFIRGGRLDEVGYYLEGVPITNPVTGGRAVTIVQDAVEEINVQAGGYTAEFGGANAGIIRQELKTGPRELKASLEYITDNVGFNSKTDRFSGDKRLGTYWYGYNEVTGTIGGPIVNDRYRFFLLFNNNYHRDNNPQPYPGIHLGMYKDPTTGDSLNVNYPAGPVQGNAENDYTGTATFSMDFKPILVRLTGTYSDLKGLNTFNTNRNPGNIANMLNLARTEHLDRTNGSGSIKITHIITPSLYYEITGGYFLQKQNVFDPYLKDNFLSYGDSVANANVGFVWQRTANDLATHNTGRFLRPTSLSLYDFRFNSPGDVVAGYQKARRENITFTGALSLTAGKEHSIKIGGEFERYTIRNYSWGNEPVFALAGIIDANNRLPDNQKKTLDDLFNNSGINAYGYDIFGNEINGGINGPKHPVFAAGYIQDKIEYQDLVINAGIRYDYIDTDNKQLIDPTRPELTFNYSNGAVDPKGLLDVPTFHAISPRLGLSFPVTDRTVFHTQFGKFVQQTRLADIYQGYGLTFANVKGGFFINTPVGFNLRPTRTTQYEIGFTQQIADFASVDITGYYKDIKDQVVYNQIKVNASSPFLGYYILTNGDFATTKGLELTFNMRRTQRVAVNASLSFQDARGTGSFPNSNRGIVGAPLENTVFTPKYISPLEYNNALRGSVNLDYRFGRDEGPSVLHDFGTSLLFTFTSGHPFTRGVGGDDLEGDARDRRPVEPLNASTTPATFQVDLRIEKGFYIMDQLNASIYVYVINLFDRKNIENVFLRTGTTTDDGVLSNPANASRATPEYSALYRAINIDYYERYQNAVGLLTVPYFYGPPRQIRLGIRLEY